MRRARLLVLKAHPDLAHAAREKIITTRFLLGLYNRQLAASLAVVKIQIAADAERLADEGEAVHRDQRPGRFDINLLHEGARVNELDDSAGADLKPLDENEEGLTAAIGRFSATHRADTQSGKLPKRRKATSTTKCYGCGQYGHFKSDCPRPVRSLDERSISRPSLECLLCNGNHIVRDCLSLLSTKSLLRREAGRDTNSSNSPLPTSSFDS